MYSKDLPDLSRRLCRASGKNNIILSGFQGCGKTTLGEQLAGELSLRFIDTDRLMEEKHQTKVHQLHRKIGEKAFRQEEEVLIASLERVENSVIALGGGAILSPKNRIFLEPLGVVIYLAPKVEDLIEHLLSRSPFPSYLNPYAKVESIKELFRLRDPIYREFSDGILPVCFFQKENHE